MDPKTMFDGFDQEEYAEEARQRWGGMARFMQAAIHAYCDGVEVN